MKKITKKPTAKTTKPNKNALKAVKNTKKIPRNINNPFREGSYSSVFDVLSAHSSGISLKDLHRKVSEQLRLKGIKKPDTHVVWDCRVVCSAKLNQLSHASIRNASDHYYIEATNNHYKLIPKTEKANENHENTTATPN